MILRLVHLKNQEEIKQDLVGKKIKRRKRLDDLKIGAFKKSRRDQARFGWQENDE